MSFVNITLVDRIGTCIRCRDKNHSDDEEEEEEINEVIEKSEKHRKLPKLPEKSGNSRKGRIGSGSEAIEMSSFVEEKSEITVVHTEFYDYDELVLSSEIETTDIIFLNKKGELLFCQGPRLNIFIDNINISENVVNFWKECSLNSLFAVFESILEKQKPQLEIVVNLTNTKLRIFGTYTTNKRDDIDNVIIIVKPSVIPIETVKKLIVT